MGFPRRGNVGSHGVSTQEEHIAIASRSQDDRMRSVAFHLTCHQVAGNDSSAFAVDDHHIHHFMAVVQLHFAFGNLAAQRRVGTQKQLLTRLALRVKCAGNLNPTERTVVKQSAIISRKRNALRHALVDDVRADFRQTVNIRLPAAVVSSFHRVVKQAVGGIPVVLVVLRGIDAPLGRNRVCATRRILEAKRLDVVTHLSKRRSG